MIIARENVDKCVGFTILQRITVVRARVRVRGKEGDVPPEGTSGIYEETH